MPIDRTVALADIDAVLKMTVGNYEAVAQVATTMKACVQRWAPAGSYYWREAEQVDALDHRRGPGKRTQEEQLRAVLMALRRDYDVNLVVTFEESVHAAVFADLLDHAKYLLEGTHLLAAAVVGGAALEEHFRLLCRKHGIATSTGEVNLKKKTGHALNDDLKGAGAYSPLQWRKLQPWIDMRNQAAHGEPQFNQQSGQDVRGMLDGIQDFILRHPA